MPQTKTIQRHSRPKGFTNALYHIHKQHNKHKLKQLQRIIIEQWSLNSYQYNGELYSINNMAEYLKLPTKEVMERMNKAILGIAGVYENNEKGRKFARAQISQLIFKGLENEALARSQVELLMRDQAGHYKPFLTTEVNRSIANLLNSGKPLLEILKLLTEKDPQPLIGQLQVNTDNRAINHITTDQAIKMIRDNSTSLLDIGTKDPAYLEYKDLPNVDARTQDLTSIGIKTLATEAKVRDKGKGIKGGLKKARKAQFGHGNRDPIIEVDEE